MTRSTTKDTPRRRNRPKDPLWVQTLKTSLIASNNLGWKIKNVRQKIQIAVIFDVGSTTTVMTKLAWELNSLKDLINTASLIKEDIAGGESLTDAFRMHNGNDSTTGPQSNSTD